MRCRYFKLPTSVILLCLVLGLAGCGANRGGSDDEYKAAITSYMAAKSMGMVVSSINDAEADGAKAVVTAKVKDAEGLYNMELRDGTWTVVSHSQR